MVKLVILDQANADLRVTDTAVTRDMTSVTGLPSWSVPTVVAVPAVMFVVPGVPSTMRYWSLRAWGGWAAMTGAPFAGVAAATMEMRSAGSAELKSACTTPVREKR